MEYQLVMNISLDKYIIPDKFATAVILSAGAHLAAFYLASSWAVDIHEKETPKLETIITKVRLVEPAKPKPPETRVIEATPWLNSYHKNAAQALAKPMKNPTEVKVAGIDPTHLTSFTNRVENNVSLSPRRLTRERSSQSSISPAKVLSQERTINSQSEKTPRSPSSDSSVVKVHTASPVQTFSMESYQFNQTTVLSPKSLARESSSQFSIRPAKALSQMGSINSLSEAKPRSISSDPSFVKVHTVSPVETSSNGSYHESPIAKPAAIPKKQNSDEPISLITAARPSSFKISQYSDKHPSPIEPSGKTALEFKNSPATIIEDNPWKNFNGLQRRDPFIPIIRENSEPNTHSRPANLSDFQTKYSSSKKSSPVKMASVPRDFKSSAPGSNISGDELTKILGEYTRKVRDKIAQVKRFPRLARDRGYEGQPVVAFTLKKDGSLLDYSLAVTSGHSILDKSALETVKKAVPYPGIPGKLNLETINLKLPISYILQ